MRIAKGAKTPIAPHKIWELPADAAPQVFARNVHTVLKMLINVPGFGFKTVRAPRYLVRSSNVLWFLRRFSRDSYALVQFVLHTRKSDELACGRNEQLLNEVFQQLGLDWTKRRRRQVRSHKGVIWSGDQLTTSRLCGLKALRSTDGTLYEQPGR